jgi:hypothetical protein
MPTPNEYHLDPGNDLSTFGAAATALLNLVKLALPNEYHGGIIYAETTPAVVGQPTDYPTDWYEWHQRCIWIKPSDGSLWVYKGGWVSIFDAIPDGTITTAMIAAGAVTLAKLAIGTGTPLQLIRINAAGTAYEFVNPNSIVTALPVSAINNGGTGRKALISLDSTVSWEIMDSAFIIGLFGDNEIPASYISYGTARQVLATNAAGNLTSWTGILDIITDGLLPVTKLSPGSSNALKSIRVNGAGNAFEFYTPATATTPNITQVTNEISPLPGFGTSSNSAHGLGVVPTVVHGCLVNIVAEAGYQQYDVVDLNSFVMDLTGAGDQSPKALYTYSANNTNVTVTTRAQDSGYDPYVVNKATGDMEIITPANWKFRYTAIRYY